MVEKKKGSGFERDIAKFLTKYITGVEKPYCIWRTPQSGGLNTISGAVDVSGDLCALNETGKILTDIFCFELKNGYDDADFFKHFKESKNNIIRGFWDQCIRDARLCNKWGILIFKKKNNKPIIGIETPVYSYLENYVDLSQHIVVSFDNDLPNVVFYDFYTFFDKVSLEVLKNMTPFDI